MTDDTVQVNVRLPDELKRLLDADRRTNQEIVKAALWREFGGERQDAIERRIEEKQRRISVIQSEKKEREDELERERQALDALRAKRGEAEDRAGERRRACIRFLDTMERANKFVFRDHEDVAELARNHFDGDREAAIEKLRELNDEEGYGFKEARFGQ